MPKDLVLKARAKAILAGTNLSAIVREFLEEWVQEDPPKTGESKEK